MNWRRHYFEGGSILLTGGTILIELTFYEFGKAYI